MYFDRFDICEAWYLYAVDYHNGQWSKEYKIFGRLNKMQFRPAPGLTIDKLTENGRAIYDRLVNGDSRINDR